MSIMILALVLALAAVLALSTFTGAWERPAEGKLSSPMSGLPVDILNPGGEEAARFLLTAEQGIGPIQIPWDRVEDDAYRLATAKAAALSYGELYYRLSADNPLKAADVKLHSLRTEWEEPDALTAIFSLALRPAWHDVNAAKDRLNGDYESGTGNLDGYVIFYIRLPMTRGEEPEEGWFCGAPAFMTRGALEELGIALAPPVSGGPPLAVAFPPLERFYPEIIQAYESWDNQTQSIDAVLSDWMEGFRQQFIQFSPDCPGASDGMPEIVEGPTINYRVEDKVNFQFTLAFTPRDLGGALAYYGPNCVQATGDRAGQLLLTWTVVLYPHSDENGGSYWASQSGDLIDHYPLVVPGADLLAGTSFRYHELDAKAISVPEKHGDFVSAFAMELAGQFYSMTPDSHLLADDVQLLSVEGQWTVVGKNATSVLSSPFTPRVLSSMPTPCWG